MRKGDIKKLFFSPTFTRPVNFSDKIFLFDMPDFTVNVERRYHIN